MKLKPEEFKAKGAEILQNLSDQGKVSLLLAELYEHNDGIVAEHVNATSTATQLTSDNEKLRKTNMDLFMKLGTPSTVQPDGGTPTNTKPSYDSLFGTDGKLL